jgi:serine/threonine protein kinase
MKPRLRRTFTQCGSECYIAPEVVAGNGYGTKVDIWSAGVTMLVMLSGCLPDTSMMYDQEYQDELLAMLHDDMVGSGRFSAAAFDLLRRMVKINPRYVLPSRHVMVRLTVSSLCVWITSVRAKAEEALAHPWFHTGDIDTGALFSDNFASAPSKPLPAQQRQHQQEQHRQEQHQQEQHRQEQPQPWPRHERQYEQPSHFTVSGASEVLGGDAHQFEQCAGSSTAGSSTSEHKSVHSSTRPSLEAIIPLHAPELTTRPSLESIPPEHIQCMMAPPYWSQADEDECESTRVDRSSGASAGSFMLHASPIAPERWIAGVSFANDDIREAAAYAAPLPVMATSQGFLSPLERRLEGNSPRSRSPRSAPQENPPSTFMMANDDEHDGMPVAWSSDVNNQHWLDDA